MCSGRDTTAASQVALVVKNPPANAGDIRDMVSIPGLGRSPGGGLGKPAKSHYGRSCPWRDHEENTGQARPSGTPSMTRSWGKTWQARPSRIRDPPVGLSLYPTLYPSPPFLVVFLFSLLQILVLPAESSPAPLSLNKDQLKTLINKSPQCWYPMKGPGMKEMLQFKPFCWHSGLFDKCVLSLHKMLMIVLNILSTVR